MSHYNVAVFSSSMDGMEEILKPFNQVVDADSPYAEFEEDAEAGVDAKTGKHGYWINPNARYDYYSLGGRWRGMLRLKPDRPGIRAPLNRFEKDYLYEPGRCDMARVRDCLFTRDEGAYRRALRRWEIMVEGAKPENEEEDYLLIYKPEYYLNRYGEKENYATYESAFLPYAFISADGTWRSCANMGWFGCDDGTRESLRKYKTEFEEYLKQAEQEDLMIGIYDFHI